MPPHSLRTWWRRASRKYRARQLRDGLCLGCATPTRRRYCPACRVARREYMRTYMQEYRNVPDGHLGAVGGE
jgi:hypothetical protein